MSEHHIILKIETERGYMAAEFHCRAEDLAPALAGFHAATKDELMQAVLAVQPPCQLVVDGFEIGGATLPEQLALLGRMFPPRTTAEDARSIISGAVVLGLLGQIQTKGEA